jgi:drug/metabolite transporter superfamily protein YnfA
VAARGGRRQTQRYDWAGALVALCGMLIIVAGWGRA